MHNQGLEIENMNFKNALLTSLKIFFGGFIVLSFGIYLNNMWIGFLGIGTMLFSIYKLIIFFYRLITKKVRIHSSVQEEKASTELLTTENKDVYQETQTTQRPIYKKWWFWLIILYLIGFIGNIIEYIKERNFNGLFYSLLVSLFIFSLIGLILGLKRPSSVLWWSRNKSKKQVLLTYGITTLIFFFLLSIFTPPPKTEQTQNETSNKLETVKSQKKEPFLELSEITKNLNNTEVMWSKVIVEGKTEVGTQIKINNKEVTVDENGNFKDIVELSIGRNKIEIVADNGYKRKKITLTIKRLGEKEIAQKQRGNVPTQSKNWTENIPQWVKDKLTSEQLKEIINLINKTSPELRQTFASDYAKELAQKNKIIALGVWAKSLGLSINYQMDDAWEIVERIKRKTNDFAYYQDEIKFLELIVTVTDKVEGQKEYQKFLEDLLNTF